MFVLLVSILFLALYFTSPNPSPRKDAQTFSMSDFRERNNLQNQSKNEILNISQIKKPPKQSAQVLELFRPKQGAKILPFRKPKK